METENLNSILWYLKRKFLNGTCPSECVHCDKNDAEKDYSWCSRCFKNATNDDVLVMRHFVGIVKKRCSALQNEKGEKICCNHLDWFLPNLDTDIACKNCSMMICSKCRMAGSKHCRFN
jgi:hypothetical protein